MDPNEKEGMVTLRTTIKSQKDVAVASMGMKLLMAKAIMRSEKQEP